MRKPEEIAQIIESNISVSNSAFLKNIGLSGTTIANMKSGSMPSADKIGLIAEALDVSVDYLLGIQKKSAPDDDVRSAVIEKVRSMSDEQAVQLLAFLESMLKSEK